MSRNGSGTYTLPVNSWNPATNGVSATASDWQSLIDDVETALTASLAADGQTPMTGNLAMGNNKLTGLAAGTAAGNSLRWEQLFSQGTEVDIASATTTDIGGQNSNFLRITGTTTITSFGTNYNGPRFIRFADALTLTDGTALNLPGSANITTVAGDYAIAYPKANAGTPNGWKVWYLRGSALPALSGANTDITSLSAPALGAATATTQSAGDNTTKVATTAFVTAATPAASATVSGLVELATTAETQTGTDTARAVTPAGLNGAIGFSNLFTSTAQTITTAGQLVIPHGLTKKPVLVAAYMTCVTGELGYTSGDEIAVNVAGDVGTGSWGMSVLLDATNLTVRFGASGMIATHKTTGVGTLITNGNWTITFRAWA